jgi:hypothetical protein
VHTSILVVRRSTGLWLGKFQKKSAGIALREIHPAKKSSQMPSHRHHHHQNGLQYFVIGDVAPEDLRALSDLVKK